MTPIQRTKLHMMAEGRVHMVTHNTVRDMIVDSVGIRFNLNDTNKTIESACVRKLDYADESKRTIESVLESEVDNIWGSYWTSVLTAAGIDIRLRQPSIDVECV